MNKNRIIKHIYTYGTLINFFWSYIFIAILPYIWFEDEQT